MMFTASITILTIATGFLLAFISVISPGLIDSIALSAFFKYGMAAYKSRLASYRSAEIVVLCS